jgi:hypothetical protein
MTIAMSNPDKVSLFNLVEKYMKAKHGKDLMVVDPNPMPEGYVVAYAPGIKEPVKITKEELEIWAKEQDQKETAPTTTDNHS